ncbi:hypothetical protein BKA58DRAFT_457741 [Alternaria rosae]|uniref:uncharacterized protein n=1 Tax=Alternaria rosae TaxID=1187941 RepID=UPI001E8CF22E|nr:uncharacterized protein BKA58DRAFT_457741 [Alternaria rosae]KAH6870304.1 hypothetical protein BKA58DRAFT_457741 [Alternaria rosae]
MSKSCVICGTEESEGELLLEAPCGRHLVCADDIGSFFENATNNESLYPPQCCDVMFVLDDYEDYVPFEVAWAYQVKQQGEYTILAKFRTYCANPSCARFLPPGTHVEDPESKIIYAICEAEECGKLTCVKCQTALDQGARNHKCEQSEDDKKFKQTANEKGYQECFVCGATVELAEACNHITCECGNSFCYICGENWPGLHGCPHYGPAEYDEEGYNQDGFHRDSGLSREGLTRRQEIMRARAEDEAQGDDDDDEDEDEGNEHNNPEWEVLQHLTPDQRAVVNMLPHGPREDALDQHRIELFENQGITFDQFHPQPPPPPPHPQDNGEDGDEEGENNGEDDEEPDDDEDIDAGHGPAFDGLPAEAAVHDARFVLDANEEMPITHDIPNDEDPQEVPGEFPADQNEFYDFAGSNIQVVPAGGEATYHDIPATTTQPPTSHNDVNDDAPVA